MLFLFFIFLLFLIVRRSGLYYWLIYNQTSYFTGTQKSFTEMWNDKGSRGEFLLYMSLRRFEQTGAKFVFNCYVPTKPGKTSEIDLVMIHATGIYVFENKNLDGWLFGTETQKYWTQTLPQGRGYRAHTERFYNPILQNNTHIACLKKYLIQNHTIESIIVFSNQCVLKSISPCITDDYSIFYRNQVFKGISKLINTNKIIFDSLKVQEMYNLLLPLSMRNDFEKNTHIYNIQQRYRQ